MTGGLSAPSRVTGPSTTVQPGAAVPETRVSSPPTTRVSCQVVHDPPGTTPDVGPGLRVCVRDVPKGVEVLKRKKGDCPRLHISPRLVVLTALFPAPVNTWFEVVFLCQWVPVSGSGSAPHP